MNNSVRLQQIEEHLELLRQQQVVLEKEAILQTGLPKVQAMQRLKLDVKLPIKDYEEEYWRILSQHSESFDISEQEAEIVVAEIVQEVNSIEQNKIVYPDEMMMLLMEIRDRLNQPGTTAAAKLKGVISSFPPFVGISYEAELDTENFLRKHFPTLTNFIKSLTNFIKNETKKKLP